VYTSFEIAYRVALVYATLGDADGEIAAGVFVNAIAELAGEAEEGSLAVVARFARSG
jgi:hypothetical protein